MKTKDNTILITGGGSGIGRGLAEAFHAIGNKVIIAGRRRQVLDEVTRANPGMVSVTLDISNPDSIRTFADQVVADHPELNVVINNAGIARYQDLRQSPAGLEDSEAMVVTNVLGPIRLNAALLPHLLKQDEAMIINVSSGLAFVPAPRAPVYSATKAALHSYTQAMRYQLRATKVKVLEIIPPYVQTELGGSAQASDPRAMPLKDFIAETMQIIINQPDEEEVCVERVKPMRFAEANGSFGEILETLGKMTS